MHAQSKIQQPQSNYRTVIPSVSYSKVVSGQIREISHVNTPNSNFSTIFTNVIQIANDEGVDEELLAQAFRAALPALRKLSHPDNKACEIFQAYVALKNGQTKLEPGQESLIANYHLNKDDRVVFPRIRTEGGTAIYCKSNFVQSRAPLLGIQYMDATAIEIKINNFPLLRVVSAYARFCVEINRKFPEKDFLKILNSGNKLIIAGDLNAAHKTWNNTSNEHLDVAIGRIGENISEAFVAASKPKFKTAPIKLPPDFRSKIRHRNRIRKFWQRSRDPALKNELSTISNEIASDIRTFPVQDGRKQLGSFGSIAVAPIEKAEVIADSLQKQFEPNTDVENPRFSAHIQRKVQRFLDSPTCMDLEKTSPSEIQGFIKNLKPNQSPGIDLITNRILKNLPTKFIIFIALLFNMLLENCYFPKSWRMTVVIPILKYNSEVSNPQNYRPISLLSSLSKAYEFVILNWLNQHCLARNIIIPEQHGFVTKCSTVTQLLRVTELVHTGFQNHQATGILFVDIAKAFDKIWHDGLVFKMMRLGFSDQILKIIHSYLNSREFRVRVENCLSSPRPVKSGIPQVCLEVCLDQDFLTYILTTFRRLTMAI
ncbi:RNA-directed DNA polymerase from mobile element jockey [Trichonephila clavipes]|nr:RNA-directed DNA polymerase from mobile element jockey [Trichonephila clavipes]